MAEVRSLDLTPNTAPALSTTSDMPKAGTKLPPVKGAVSEEELASGGTEAVKAKAKADEAKKEPVKEEPKAESKEAKVEDKAEPKVEDKAEPKDDTPAWQKREITKARNRQREAETRAQSAEERLDKALLALEKAAERSGTKVETEAPDPRPVRTAYDDPEKYEADLVTWSAKAAAKVTQAEIEKSVKEREAKEAKDKTEKETQASVKKRMDAWAKSKAEAIEKYPDYEEVAEADTVSINQAMAYAILEENLDTGKGTEIAYYLGQHPDEAAKIAALTTQSAVDRAIGKLADRLEREPVKPVSKAPEPPKPLGSRAGAIKKSADNESMEEYAARRKAELKAQRANAN